MKQVAGHFDGHGPPTGQPEQLVAREFAVRTKLAEPDSTRSIRQQHRVSLSDAARPTRSRDVG
jgi:hypothetical protein